MFWSLQESSGSIRLWVPGFRGIKTHMHEDILILWRWSFGSEDTRSSLVQIQAVNRLINSMFPLRKVMLQQLHLYWFNLRPRPPADARINLDSNWGTGGSSPGEGSCESALILTCNEEVSGARRLSGAVGGSDGKSATVCGGHSGDSQNSAAVAERDLNAGQRGGRKNLAITEPAHLRNWRTCRENPSV